MSGDGERFALLQARSVEHEAMGLCRSCKNPAEEGKKSCSAHLDYYRLKRRERLREGKRTGMCSTCAIRPPSPGMASCEVCRGRSKSTPAAKRTRKNAKARMRIRKLDKQGRCQTCRAPSKPGRTQCSKHMEYRSDRSRKRSSGGLCVRCGEASSTYRCSVCREIHREQANAIRLDRKVAGVCVRCGKHKATKRVECYLCFKAARCRKNAWMRAWKAKNREKKLLDNLSP